MAGHPYPEGFGRIGRCGDRGPRFLAVHKLKNALTPSDGPAPVSFRNQSRRAGLGHSVRIDSKKWTAAQIERLLVDAGSSAASAAVALKRSITVVQTKARSLGKPFQIAASRR
jgi:hypothetical protein